MSQFQPLLSQQKKHAAGSAQGPQSEPNVQFASVASNSSAPSVPYTKGWVTDTRTVAFSTEPLDVLSQQQELTSMAGRQLVPRRTMPLHDVPTTQSLISALQSTMPATLPERTPVIIPGSRKITRQLLSTTDELRPVRRMPLGVRHGITVGMLFFFFVTTLVSLTPLGSDRSSYSLADGAFQWVQAQQAGWNVAPRKTLGGASPSAVTPPQQSPKNANLPKSEYVEIARKAARKEGIPEQYFVNQINQESHFDPNARSPVGATGIAQFMPATAAGMGINPHDPIESLYAAAQMMRELRDQYSGDYSKALAAYNYGSGNLLIAVNNCGDAWLSCTPYETQHYVATIMV